MRKIPEKIKLFVIENLSLWESRVGMILIYFFMLWMIKHFLGFETAVIYGIAVLLADMNFLLPKK